MRMALSYRLNVNVNQIVTYIKCELSYHPTYLLGSMLIYVSRKCEFDLDTYVLFDVNTCKTYGTC